MSFSYSVENVYFSVCQNKNSKSSWEDYGENPVGLKTRKKPQLLITHVYIYSVKLFLDAHVYLFCVLNHPQTFCKKVKKKKGISKKSHRKT